LLLSSRLSTCYSMTEGPSLLSDLTYRLVYGVSGGWLALFPLSGGGVVWRNSANLCARRALGAYVPLVGGLVAAPTSAVSSLRDQRAEIFLAFLLPSPARGVGGFQELLLAVCCCALRAAARSAQGTSSPFSRRSERLLGCWAPCAKEPPSRLFSCRRSQ